MIGVLLASVAAVAIPPTSDTTVDFDTFSVAVGKCERRTVTEAIAAAGDRHSGFLLSAYAEQRAIVTARGELVTRRARLRGGERGDTEAALTLAGIALDDRERALADARALDRSEQELVGYLRGQYLTRCSGKSGS